MASRVETYLPWFILKELPGLTSRKIKQLIRVFKTPAAILDASKKELATIDGMGPKAIASITGHDKFCDAANAALDQVKNSPFKLCALTDTTYPALLKKILDPPPLFYFDGTLVPDAPCIAIVGSRNATRYGIDTAQYLAHRLTDLGFTIVSGMALGIDTAAHKGALSSPSGKTLAVLGSGLGHIYPRQNKSLYGAIKQSGAVISEFTPNTTPLPAYFPQRNRIIAGLCTGTIVVEAAKKSGSLITARLAGEYNREVFAVPGSIRSTRSRGTHALIKQGAHLVENEMDVLDELAQFVHVASAKNPSAGHVTKQKPAMDKTQTIVYKHLDPYPKHIDRITASTGLSSAEVSAALLDMELSGLIVRHSGNNFSTSEE